MGVRVRVCVISLQDTSKDQYHGLRLRKKHTTYGLIFFDISALQFIGEF